jgi:DNA-binding IclR family transcriptional regulator
VTTLDGRTAAAISCTVPKSRLDEKDFAPAFILGVLQRQAAAISIALGSPFDGWRGVP